MAALYYRMEHNAGTHYSACIMFHYISIFQAVPGAGFLCGIFYINKDIPTIKIHQEMKCLMLQMFCGRKLKPQ